MQIDHNMECEFYCDVAGKVGFLNDLCLWFVRMLKLLTLLKRL